jgi:hypothetical protein
MPTRRNVRSDMPFRKSHTIAVESLAAETAILADV